MQKIRYYFAFIVAKLVTFLLRVLHKRVPYYPGYVALRICPDFLTIVRKPPVVIAVTGTNGKSTISALLIDAFEELGYKVINNHGFNVKDGITAMFLQDMKLFGKRGEVAILEVDEKSSKDIYASVKPNYLICTNLFRDSMRSNSNIEYIAQKILEGIPKDTKVIMPADDLITVSSIPVENPIYYSLEPLKDESKEPYNLVCDLIYCPVCGSELVYTNVHYHHIGSSYCPKCGFTNPKSKYIGKVDDKKEILNVNGIDYPIQSKSIFNIYNLLSVIVCLKECQIPETKILDVAKHLHIIDSRYSSEKVGNHTIVNIMAKGQNPVACSSAFQYVANMPGSKELIIILDDVADKKYSVETVAWYYDTDFEFLNQKNINHFVLSGVRAMDVYVRLLFAGIPKIKMDVVEDETLAYQKVHLHESDNIFIIHDIHQYDQSLIIKKQLKEMIQK